jgi:DNA primase
LLKPGKSLKFASLPEGQDPDDLYRSGGREAIVEVVGAARPLADVLWTREIEASPLDTPERRAAFEARLGDVINAIGDETVRKYYRRDFGDRLRQLFEAQARPPTRDGWRRDGWRDGLRARSTGGGWPPRPGVRGRRAGERGRPAITGGEPYVVMSPQLAASPVLRGHRSAIPRREALILQAVINHPWLLHDHLEELSAIEFRHADAARLKGALIDIFAHDGAPDGDGMAAELARRGLGELSARIAKAITTGSVWGAGRHAGPEDVLMTWRQLIALHRQWHSLIKELKDAEQALGADTTEANYSWLRDVKARLAAIDGTEAVIEGFGSSSGRSAGTV